MSFRSFIFWPHLVCGVAAGIVILIMSVTGVLLTYEKQMIGWADHRRTAPVEAGSAALPVAQLLHSAAAGIGETPAAIAIASNPTSPALVTAGSRRVLVDRYTGAVIGDSAPKLRAFFRVVTDWHRWLALSGEQRVLGKAITGWSNLVFAFIVLSGMYLWLPRVWAWRNFKAVAIFKGGLRGKARDFNWHNVIGIWSAVPLFFVVISALPISFPWASALVYRIAGETPPAPAPRSAPQGSSQPSAKTSPLPIDGLDAAWQHAATKTDEWRTITLRVPASASAPFVFTIDRGNAGQPHLRGTLNVPRTDATTATWETFGAQSPGRQARSTLRFLHTGEVLGILGQTIAGIASLGGVFLVWTGLA
nr:PepSY domain-containing protein [Acidobacteriota bacterium]